ncbi:hypothetical protein KGQ29_02230 [Patescibacteria group bacterium]|nr:hypothetical protein [Patescibacteria group bacterium]
MKFVTNKYFFAGAAITSFFSLSYFVIPPLFPINYERAVFSAIEVSSEIKKISHLNTPSQVKGIYLTNWVAGDKSLRDPLVKIADDTEINSVVIDIKDYTGRIAFEVFDPLLKDVGSYEKRIADMKDFIEELHKKNIYVIGRISVFQDRYLVGKRPDLAVKRKSDGGVWKDFKGISWLDPGAKEVWDYVIALAKESHDIGFDELNFDYIRFPSDGNMKDIYYPWSKDKRKTEVIREFFAYLREKLGNIGAPLSADLFGMTTVSSYDLNIGQNLENALKYFDFVSPMVYPSHFPPYFNGYKNPAGKPYEVVKFAMDSAVDRAIKASTTPFKLRPWLQDFDLGAIYDPPMVRAQIQATYDAGLDSWMLWNASNKYTSKALDKQE